jgi:hypothetical protein
VLADAEPILGPDLTTLSTRYSLGTRLGEAGDAAGVAAAFEKVVIDTSRQAVAAGWPRP